MLKSVFLLFVLACGIGVNAQEQSSELTESTNVESMTVRPSSASPANSSSTPVIPNPTFSTQSHQSPWALLGIYRAVGVAYSSASEVASSSVKVTTGGASTVGPSRLEFESELTLMAEVGLRQEGFGWNLGLEYDLPRESYSVHGVDLQLMNINASLIYFAGSKYAKFGGNYSIVSIETSEKDISVSAASGFGAQLGVGMFLDKDLALELMYRKLNFEVKIDGTSGDKANFGMVKFDGLQAGLKYFF